ncbi:hypothetical protein ACFL6M_00620 [Candidatus Eisenbacteria bacterium]|uniref:Uncharacterized protein n=1 Tax=Eiseniibacteriota bacterium TaxID=2212470 RepID=A0ABV6YIB6_UNCEI
MRDKIPLALLIIMGIFGLTDRFIPHPAAEAFNAYLRDTLLRIISAFALILGLGNLILRHINKIKHRQEHYRQSYTLLISFGLASIIGLFGGVNGELWLKTNVGDFAFDITTIYNKVLIPLGASMFSLLAFFMASAAYRSFKARSWLACLLLISAFIVMLGQVPLGAKLWSGFPEISQWIMEVPNTAAKRGIELGVTLGVLATLLKILAGIERSWLGSG